MSLLKIREDAVGYNGASVLRGLNLTIETLDGLLKHNGPIDDLSTIDKLVGLKIFKNLIFKFF